VSTARPRLEWRVPLHARRLVAVTITALAAAVITGEPGLVALAAVPLLLLAEGRRAKPKEIEITVRLSAVRVYEGEQLAADVTVEGHRDFPVEIILHLHPGGRPVDGADRAAGATARLRFELQLWGRSRPGFVEVVLHDRAHVFVARQFVTLPEVSCYPMPTAHRQAKAIGRLAHRAGDHPARTTGEGAEFSGVREYVPGDRQRSINWPATTRRGRLQVNTFAPERSQDVVLVVDATSDIGELGSSTLDRSLRGALGIARTYLDARDRVGLVMFGAGLVWLTPGLGERQFWRILESVLDGRAGWSSGNELRRVPRPALPPGAAVVVFSPLLSPRVLEALRDLRERGFPVIVVDPLDAAMDRARTKADRVVQQLWRMERQSLQFSLRELGITVVAWDGEPPLVLPVSPRSRRPGRVGP
jgi:uncharacterized protein (DUF58 family)